MKETARLFLEILARPLAALTAFASGDSGLKAPFAIFAFYSVLHALVLPALPPAFTPEAPAQAFGNPFYYYLAAAPLNLFIAALLAAFLPSAAAFFSAGQIAVRVLASVGILAASFIAAAAAVKIAALSWLLPSAFMVLAALAFQSRKNECRRLFAVILAAAAVSLAMIPLEILAIALNSKPVFEIFSAAEAVWILWLLVKALGIMGYSSAPRRAAAVFFTAALCGALIFSLAKLLPERLAAILLIS